jgi:4'-phosphopantetheinyl transferase
LAVAAPDSMIGADVEAIERAAGWEEVMDRHFTATEIASVRSVSAPDQPRAFLTLWTAKEACLKADGRGVTSGIEAVEIWLDPSDPRATPVEGSGTWSLRSVAVTEATVACIASALPLNKLRAWEWRPSAVRT